MYEYKLEQVYLRNSKVDHEEIISDLLTGLSEHGWEHYFSSEIDTGFSYYVRLYFRRKIEV